MNVRINFEDFPKICRLCLSFEHLDSIFKVKALDLLTSIANIQVKEDDKLPENICYKCIEQLEIITLFIRTCKYNDEFLKSILSALDNQLQGDDDDCCYGESDIKNESDIDIDVEDINDGDLTTKTTNILLSKDINLKKRESEEQPSNDDLCPSESNDCSENNKNEEENPVISNLHLKEIKPKKQKRIQKELRLKISKFSCTKCNKSYKHKKRLDSHLKRHDEEKPLEVIKTEENLLKDLAEAVKIEIVTESETTDLNFDKEGSLKCEKCGSRFVSQSHLENHVNCQGKDNNSSTKEEITNIIDYLNDSEEKKVKTVKEDPDEEVEYINGRKLKGKRQFLCNYCGKNYTRKNGLERHILSHTGVKPFECRECGKCYTTKDTLKTHLLTHTGVKAFKCKVCQKSFTQSSHLSYHMRRHAGEKPYICSFCNKAFLSTYHLERHKLMHTGVKPFECKLCGKHFVRNTTLRDHLLIHTGEKPFQCQHCGKQFNRKQTLTNHMLVHNLPTRNSGNFFGPNLLYEINIPDVSNMQGTVQNTSD